MTVWRNIIFALAASTRHYLRCVNNRQTIIVLSGPLVRLRYFTSLKSRISLAVILLPSQGLNYDPSPRIPSPPFCPLINALIQSFTRNPGNLPWMSVDVNWIGYRGAVVSVTMLFQKVFGSNPFRVTWSCSSLTGYYRSWGCYGPSGKTVELHPLYG